MQSSSPLSIMPVFLWRHVLDYIQSKHQAKLIQVHRAYDQLYTSAFIDSKLASVDNLMCISCVVVGDDDVSNVKRNKCFWLYGKTRFTAQEAIDATRDVHQMSIRVPDAFTSLVWDLNVTQVTLMIVGNGANLKHKRLSLTLTSRNQVDAVYVRGLSFLKLSASNACIFDLDIANCLFVSGGTLKTSNQVTNLTINDTVFCNAAIDIRDKANYNWSTPNYNTIRIDRCKFTMDRLFADVNWGIIHWSRRISSRYTSDSFVSIINCFIQVMIPLLWCCPLDLIVIMNNYISSCVALIKNTNSNIAFANNTMSCNRALVTKPFSRSNVTSHHLESCELENSFVTCNLKQALDILKQIGCDQLANHIKSVAIRYIDSDCMSADAIAADVAIHNWTFDASVPSYQAILKS